MTAEQKTRASKLLTYLGTFIQHRSDCSSNLSFSNPASDYCDCRLSTAYDHYKELEKILESA